MLGCGRVYDKYKPVELIGHNHQILLIYKVFRGSVRPNYKKLEVLLKWK